METIEHLKQQIEVLSKERTKAIVSLNESLDRRLEVLCREKIAECERLQAENAELKKELERKEIFLKKQNVFPRPKLPN